MPKFRRLRNIARAVILSVVVLGLAVLIVGTSKSFQGCIDEGKHHAGGQDFEKSIAGLASLVSIYRDCTGEFLHKNGEAVTAAFTIVLAISTIFLWRATERLFQAGERQIEFLRASSERQVRDTEIVERAYLTVEARGMEPGIDRDDRIHGIIAIRNVGHLPARNVSWFVTTKSDLTDEGFPIDPIEPRTGVLHPGAEMVIRGNNIFVDRLGHATFVWGMVTYEDGFGNLRYTKFCHWYSTKAHTGRLGLSLPPQESNYNETGNEAT
jgi:hypothetical protein